MLMTPPHRAVNTKTYLVSWPEANSKLVEPLTTCTDGQRVELYLVREGVSFESGLPKASSAHSVAIPRRRALCDWGGGVSLGPAARAKS